ncbi:MAG: T9SS type A sorting domain-containing protein, partial [Candidatus Latescibacteria bacterium]|nr:T9SS type A sorting domain-containing protein [Candidatus Latescibacterota bacterium]
PNPFNPTTVIGYALPEGSNVRLEIYNTLGQVVRTLVDGEQAGGVYRMTWDGRNEHGQEMATGVYIYRIVAGDFQATKRMLLIK